MKKIILLLTITLTTAHLFAEAFSIEHYEVRMRVTAQAVLEVTETIDVVFTEERHGIIRKIPFRFPINGNVQSTRPFQSSGNEIQTFITKIQVDGVTFETYEEGNYSIIKIGDADKKVNGAQRYVIHYQVYNAINFFNDHSELYWNIVGPEWETNIQNATFHITWDAPLPKSYKTNSFVATGRYGAQEQNATLNFSADGRSASGTTTASLAANEGLTVGIAFPAGFLTATPIPIEAFATKFYIKNQSVSIRVHEDGVSEVSERYTLHFVTKGTQFERDFRPFVSQQPSSFRDWLGGGYKYLITNIEATGGERCNRLQANSICIKSDQQSAGTEQEILINYQLYGNFVKAENATQGKLILDYTPLYSIAEPTFYSRVDIELPEGIANARADFQAYIEDASANRRDVRTRQLDRFFEVATDSTTFLRPEENLIFQLSLPKDYFKTNNQLYEWRLLWLNNRFLLLPILIFIILYYIWNRWGRDEPITKMVHYYPPENLSPAEAGILIDDQLHDRDLLSLIPYWGAKGLIQVREEGTDSFWKKDEYIFKLLKPISDDAPAYEKTMFDGIFGSNQQVGEEVKLSSLKYKFHTNLQTAKKQLEQQITSRSFYMPRTRGGGTFLKVLGIIFAVTGIPIFFVGYISGGEIGTIELGVGLVITGILSFIFGKIMPKKAPLGLEIYKQLAGFELFVKDAELPRLETFLKEDPNYFDKTLPYAIAFNHVEKWSKKFQALSVPPPNWYHSPSNNTFSTILFTESLSDAMRNIGNTFTSVESSSGSSGGSFSGGGGFSGGGFGGGGGSSW